MTTNHCISHVKDIDGLASAALVLAAKGGTFKLTDYDGIMNELDSVEKGSDELVICDLGTDPARLGEFAKKLAALAKSMKVTYIDHHYLTPTDKKRIKATGVELRHDTSECASMLTYLTFSDRLPESAKLLALFGAVTDYMDGSPRASKLMETFDRQYVLLEATMASYALARNGKDYAYVERFVKELAKMKAPHTIDGVGRDAIDQAEVVRTLADEVSRKGVRMEKIAYMSTGEMATGNVAKLLLGAFGTSVAVAYKVKPNGMAEASLRSTSDCTLHLGKEIGKIATKHGGTGGGHARAAGCSVPAGKIDDVLRALDARVRTQR